MYSYITKPIAHVFLILILTHHTPWDDHHRSWCEAQSVDGIPPLSDSPPRKPAGVFRRASGSSEQREEIPEKHCVTFSDTTMNYDHHLGVMNHEIRIKKISKCQDIEQSDNGRHEYLSCQRAGQAIKKARRKRLFLTPTNNHYLSSELSNSSALRYLSNASSGISTVAM